MVGNPALEAFVAHLGDEFVLGQVLICSVGAGFELRHAEDRDARDLKDLTDLRTIAQTTEAGAFRPLKSAPNLRRGWRAELRDAEELGLALNYLYPGAVADWFAVRSGNPPVTNYREFTARQTGMYRITAMLSDERTADATRACCDRKFCLKQRLWVVPGLAPDDPAARSAIPCLEPCAIMLEFARKVMRMEQEQKQTVNLSQAELETLIAALGSLALLGGPASPRASSAEVKEADFTDPLNPRRVELLLNRLKSGMLSEK